MTADIDPLLFAALRQLAHCPAQGEYARAVEAARAWLDAERSKPLEIVRKRPDGQSQEE